MSENCDKLLRLMEISGLFDPDDGSSGREWIPDQGAQVHSIPDLDDDDDENEQASHSAIPNQEQQQILNCETGLLEPVTTSNLEDQHEFHEVPNGRRIIINPESGILEEVSPDTECEEDITIRRKGKKRKSMPRLWKKNKIVKNNIKKHVMRDIPDCRSKCKTKMSQNDAKIIFNKFINLNSHTEQNIYLQGCLKETVPQRFRPRTQSPQRSRNRRVFTYHVQIRKKTIELCQKAFLSIHGIKRDRLQLKVQHPEKDIQDGRGKHNQHLTYDQETILKVHTFIEELPARESHYSRSSNKHKKYLDANLTITELHRKYSSNNPDNKISYEKFRQIFNQDFNIAFGYPRKDICSTCEKSKILMTAADANKDEQEKRKVEISHELHLRKAEVFLKKLTEIENKKDNTKLSICMDYQKNLPLPVTNISDEYYLRQLWLHNFGIHNLNENTATMYLYTEQYALKGPNEVISALNDFIEHNKKPEQVHFELLCDNCFSQNKNRFLFAFLDQLCAKGTFQTISVYYPMPGHSMMPIDRDFALIERKRLKSDKIFTPGFYVNLIKNSRNINKFDIVFFEKNLSDNQEEGRTIKVKDYKKVFEERIKASVPGISTCRKVLFRKNGRPEMTDSMTSHYMKPVSLYRTGMSRLIRDEPQDCYHGPLKLKPAKVADIAKLLEFVPEHLRYVYDDVFAENSAAVELTEDMAIEIE